MRLTSADPIAIAGPATGLDRLSAAVVPFCSETLEKQVLGSHAPMPSSSSPVTPAGDTHGWHSAAAKAGSAKPLSIGRLRDRLRNCVPDRHMGTETVRGHTLVNE